MTADDTAEIVIIPDLRAEKYKILHSIINNRGALYCQGNDNGTPFPWRGNWEVKGSVRDGFWEFEMALPLKDLGLKEGEMPEATGLRICRNWKQLAGGNRQTSWEPAKAVFASRDFLPEVVWDGRAPVVRHLQLSDPAEPQRYNVKIAVDNPHAAPLKIRALISVKPRNSAPAEEKAEIDIPPGRTVEFNCAGTALNDEPLDTLILVSSVDGETVYYQRHYEWTAQRPEAVFATAGSDEAERISAQFAYYPSFHKMRLQVDLANLKDKSGVQGVQAAIRDAAGTELARVAVPRFRQDIYEMIWAVPDLRKHTADGGGNEYTLTFQVDGVKGGTIERKFVRNPMEWEGNELGKSETIVPPFTPIEVRGNTLSTILRDHELNGLGLWEQVRADGQDLLKDGGMRLEAVIGGKAVPVKIEDFKFTVKRPARVETASIFSFGRQRAAAAAQWDYDGMMKWTLTLEPGPETIDSLKLVIPVEGAPT